MGQGVSPALPKPDLSQDSGGHGLGALPLGADELSDAEELVIVFQVATTDPATFKSAVARVQSALAGQSAAGRKICAVVTDQDVHTTVTTKQALASLITPLVARSLGVTVPA